MASEQLYEFNCGRCGPFTNTGNTWACCPNCEVAHRPLRPVSAPRRRSKDAWDNPWAAGLRAYDEYQASLVAEYDAFLQLKYEAENAPPKFLNSDYIASFAS